LLGGDLGLMAHCGFLFQSGSTIFSRASSGGRFCRERTPLSASTSLTCLSRCRRVVAVNPTLAPERLAPSPPLQVFVRQLGRGADLP